LNEKESKSEKEINQQKVQEEQQLSLDDLAIDDNDVIVVLQESIEFQEVKSKRAVAQEKKHSDPLSQSHTTHSSANSNRRTDKKESSNQTATTLSSTFTTKDSQERVLASSTSTPPTVTTPSAPVIVPPTQPAWINTDKTFKAIGIAVPEVINSVTTKVDEKQDTNNSKTFTSGKKNRSEKDKEKKKKETKSNSKKTKKTTDGEYSNLISTKKYKKNEIISSDGSSIFDVEAATRHLLEQHSQDLNNSSATDILEMSAELEKQDLSQSFSRFVPGIGLTNSDDQDDENNNISDNNINNNNVNNKNNSRNNNTDRSGLQALIGLGSSVTVSSYNSTSTW
jgi:hypothetical protein